mmetsp:Transcript_24772/g.79107  ORF Transcript_24772/g.79107 Transcript_24772/m.79107 type:complete len:294 (+) Transcript_24772:1378-2259(+)
MAPQQRVVDCKRRGLSHGRLPSNQVPGLDSVVLIEELAQNSLVRANEWLVAGENERALVLLISEQCAKGLAALGHRRLVARGFDVTALDAEALGAAEDVEGWVDAAGAALGRDDALEREVARPGPRTATPRRRKVRPKRRRLLARDGRIGLSVFLLIGLADRIQVGRLRRTARGGCERSSQGRCRRSRSTHRNHVRPVLETLEEVGVGDAENARQHVLTALLVVLAADLHKVRVVDGKVGAKVPTVADRSNQACDRKDGLAAAVRGRREDKYGFASQSQLPEVPERDREAAEG